MCLEPDNLGLQPSFCLLAETLDVLTSVGLISLSACSWRGCYRVSNNGKVPNK